jgi:hypothetical protein
MSSTAQTRTSARTAPTWRPPQTFGSRLSGAVARRWPTVLGVTAATVSLAVLAPLPNRVQTPITAWGVLVAAVIYLTWGTARGELDDRRRLTAQTAAVLGFGAAAIAAVTAAPGTAHYVLAAGWLAHAAWDVVHHHADRVVPRWYAELCMACDLVVAASLLLLGGI